MDENTINNIPIEETAEVVEEFMEISPKQISIGALGGLAFASLIWAGKKYVWPKLSTWIESRKIDKAEKEGKVVEAAATVVDEEK